jgi:copper chaperone CopZ
MKSVNLNSFFVVLLALLISVNSYAQDNKKVLNIKTNVFSFMCKDKIETAVKDLKGVEEAYLSLDDKILEVKFNSDNLKESVILQTIKDLGYEAEIIKNENSSDKKEVSKEKK